MVRWKQGWKGISCSRGFDGREQGLGFRVRQPQGRSCGIKPSGEQPALPLRGCCKAEKGRKQDRDVPRADFLFKRGLEAARQPSQQGRTRARKDFTQQNTPNLCFLTKYRRPGLLEGPKRRVGTLAHGVCATHGAGRYQGAAGQRVLGTTPQQEVKSKPSESRKPEQEDKERLETTRFHHTAERFPFPFSPDPVCPTIPFPTGAAGVGRG